MKRHFQYLKYVIKHKWFVLRAGLKVGASLWRLIIHDWSKFLPKEWIPYAHTFYDKDGNTQYIPHEDFDKAWNHHQSINKHHWQYWVLHNDNGQIKCLPIPKKYLLEMIADWMGAGRAITGKWGVKDWYEDNKDNIWLEDDTRNKVELIINILDNGTD